MYLFIYFVSHCPYKFPYYMLLAPSKIIIIIIIIIIIKYAAY